MGKRNRDEKDANQAMLVLPDDAAATISEQEKDPVKRYLRKRKELPRINCTSFGEQGGDDVALQARYADALGSASADFRDLIFEQIGKVAGTINETTFLNAALALLHSIKPENEIQAILVAEIFMLHNLFSTTAREMSVNANPVSRDSCVNRLGKLSRMLKESLAAFQKLRGQGTQQQVIVKHMHFNQGGQAIVGSVMKTDGGKVRGPNRENG